MSSGIIERGISRKNQQASRRRFLIIETGKVQDVILATVLIEKLHGHFPDASIDFLLQDANKSLLNGHPLLDEVRAWDAGKAKSKGLFPLLREIRKRKYNAVINTSTLAAPGLITAFSGASRRIGFGNNPLSFLFTKKIPQNFPPRGAAQSSPVELPIQRNLDLIKSFTDFEPQSPRLYPSEMDFTRVSPLKKAPYVCIAPDPDWVSPAFPLRLWTDFIRGSAPGTMVYLLGEGSGCTSCDELSRRADSPNLKNLCGKLSYLETAALLRDAVANYLADPVQIGLGLAVGAPLTLVSPSTKPALNPS